MVGPLSYIDSGPTFCLVCFVVLFWLYGCCKVYAVYGFSVLVMLCLLVLSF